MAIYKGNQFIGVNAVKEKPIYVEVPEGSTIDDMSSENTVAISPEEYSDLQDAVNYRVGEFTQKSIPQMINRLKQKYMLHMNQEMNVMPQNTTWTRPQDWPDLDSLNLEFSGDTDFIYMTFDSSNASSGISIMITGSNIVATYGHITNGEYISDGNLDVSSSSVLYTHQFTGENNYIVVKITGTVTQCKFMANVFNSKPIQAFQIPLLERIAYIPNITSLSAASGRGNSIWGALSLQREKINNGNGNALTNLAYAYDWCINLRSLDLSGLNTQKVTTMYQMFNRCQNLRGTLDLRHFDVAKVTTFSCMFTQCRLTEINLTGWTTTALTGSGLQSMFSGCYCLKHIYGLDNFNTTNCTNFSSIFYDCFNLQELNLANWNTAKVTNLAAIFRNCRSIKDLSFVKNWNTDKVTTLSETFSGCYSIEELDLHNWNVNLVRNVYYTFNYCLSLKQLNITGWYIHDVTEIRYCFQYCTSLEHLDISNWHITSACPALYCTFAYCFSLQELNIPNDWDTSGFTTGNYIMTNVFASCYSLKRITGISNWILPSGNTTGIFSGCYSLEEVDVSNWDTSKSKSFNSMFSNCWSLKQLNVSNWITTNVTNFASMFYQCFNLQSLNLSNFNTTNATTLSSMFYNCISLTTVGNIIGWDTGKATTLEGIFQSCYSLKSINLDGWNVTKITTISKLFSACYDLETLSLKNWNLAVCTAMTDAFYGLYNLKSLDLTNWQLPSLTTAPTTCFRYCYNLQNCTGAPIPLNHSYAQCYSLTTNSLVAIYTNLPTVTTTRTITVDTYVNNRLTAEEKAIATNKGWTISTTT